MNCMICDNEIKIGDNIEMTEVGIVHALCKEEAEFEEMRGITRKNLKNQFPIFPDDILSNLLLETTMLHIFKDMVGCLPYSYKDIRIILYIEYGHNYYYQYIDENQLQNITTTEDIIDFLLRPSDGSTVPLKLGFPYRYGSLGPTRIVIIQPHSVEDYIPTVRIKYTNCQISEGQEFVSTSSKYIGLESCE